MGGAGGTMEKGDQQVGERNVKGDQQDGERNVKKGQRQPLPERLQGWFIKLKPLQPSSIRRSPSQSPTPRTSPPSLAHLEQVEGEAGSCGPIQVGGVDGTAGAVVCSCGRPECLHRQSRGGSEGPHRVISRLSGFVSVGGAASSGMVGQGG